MITARDVTALRWMGEQYAIRFDALGVLLGHQWAVSTRAALNLVGLELPVWPVVTMLEIEGATYGIHD